jgi:hypothetical protein
VKLEKINTRLVVLIGIIIIIIVTLLFVIFRTDILSNNNGEENVPEETTTEEQERPEVPNNSDEIDGDESPSNGLTQLYNPRNIRDGVRNRTIHQNNLTAEEKQFILIENAKEVLPIVPRRGSYFCPENNGAKCSIEIGFIEHYADVREIGSLILGCSGNIIANYDYEKSEWDFDVRELRCS